jgi:hypothetical protein
MMFFEGYITQDIYSAEGFRGIDYFCRSFALKDFLSYNSLKIVWADLPTAVRVRVNKMQRCREQWWLIGSDTRL